MLPCYCKQLFYDLNFSIIFKRKKLTILQNNPLHVLTFIMSGSSMKMHYKIVMVIHNLFLLHTICRNIIKKQKEGKTNTSKCFRVPVNTCFCQHDKALLLP